MSAPVVFGLDQEGITSIATKIKMAKEILKNRGRVFVRYSGTEPVARVMVEGEDSVRIKEISDDIAASIRKELG